MIGNTILFTHYPYGFDSIERHRNYVLEGLVVDAFTNVSGNVSGKYESLFVISAGNVTGNTKSERIYKIEFYDKHDYEKKRKKYIDIYPFQFIEIIKFAGQTTQEQNEEKINIK